MCEVIVLLIWDMLYKCELHVPPLPKNVLHFSCGGYVCVGGIRICMYMYDIHKMCNRLKGLLVINTVTRDGVL